MVRDPTQRWCFCDDDDGHTYLIMADMKDKFDELLGLGDSDGYEAFSGVFDEYCINMHLSCYTFTNPQEREERG